MEDELIARHLAKEQGAGGELSRLKLSHQRSAPHKFDKHAGGSLEQMWKVPGRLLQLRTFLRR
jgi:hypothetical protein